MVLRSSVLMLSKVSLRPLLTELLSSQLQEQKENPKVSTTLSIHSLERDIGNWQLLVVVLENKIKYLLSHHAYYFSDV